MDIGDIQLYGRRWDAVEEIQNQDIRNSTPAQNWRKLNVLKARAIALKLVREDDSDLYRVYQRWVKLKASAHIDVID